MPPGGLGLPSLPNVIVFQINPETITHAWTEAAPPQAPSDPKVKVNPLAVTGVPGESFQFTLMLDSDQEQADVATDPVGAGLAIASGVYTRLAALELLQFPTLSPDLRTVGQVSAATRPPRMAPALLDSSSQSVPLSQVPVALFVWGPLRIVPVRVTAFSVTEKLFDALLNPTHAEAQITLTMLTPDEVAAVQGSMAERRAGRLQLHLGMKQAQAVA